MKYDFNFWIGVIGFIATIVFGILSIYLVKIKRYPGQITFIEEQVIGLFDSIVKNFPQITITYESKNIDKQLVLLKGALINSGSIDIKESMIEEKLCLKLPEDFKWLSAKIIGSTKGSKTNLEITDNLLFVNSGLFRKNEFLRFEALADVPSRKNDNTETATSVFKQELKFEHRIADTDKVEKRTSELILPNLLKEIGFLKLTYFLLLFVVLIYFSFFLPDKSKNLAEFNYQLKTDTSFSIFKATPHLNGTIELKSINSSDTSTIKIDEFNSRLVKTQVREWRTDGWLSSFIAKYFEVLQTTMLLLIFLLFSSLFIIKPIIEYRKIKRLRQSLQLDQPSIGCS